MGFLIISSIKDKINDPPSKIDEQEIPNSMKEFIKNKTSFTEGKLKKIIPKEDVPRRTGRPYKELPEFVMGKKEKAKAFLNRVHVQTTTKLKEAHYEAKYSVDVVRKEDGEVQIKKRTANDLENIAGSAKTKGIRKKREHIDKKKIRREKKQKIRKDIEDEKNKMYKRDEVKFGEVCHAPPQLKVIPRLGEAPETVPRPGKKALLLHSIIKQDSQVNKKSAKPDFDIGIKIKTGKLNLKGKRKDLPMRTREILETEQQSVIEQYRKMKTQQYQKNK